MDIGISCLNSKCGRENSIKQEVIMESYNGLIELRYFVNHSSSNVKDISIELSDRPNIGQWVIHRYRNERLDHFMPMDNSSMANINMMRNVFMMALLNVTSLKVLLFSPKINPPVVR